MEVLQQLGAVILVLGLLAAAVYGLRSRSVSGVRPFAKEGRGTKRIQILERVPLTAQHTLCLVRVGDQEFIVTTAPGGCQVSQASFSKSSALAESSLL